MKAFHPPGRRAHLVKSEKAKLELAFRIRELSVRERAALLLADGHKTGDETRLLLQDDGSILHKLMADGYLITVPRGTVKPVAFNDTALTATPKPLASPVKPIATIGQRDHHHHQKTGVVGSVQTTFLNLRGL